ncbi:MAG: carbohydrate porin [Chthoniobacterales bacterium]
MLPFFYLTLALFLPFTNTNQPTLPSNQVEQEQTTTVSKNQSAPVEDEDENGLLAELFGSQEIQTVPIAPYAVRPVTPHTISQYKDATGNWFGTRDFLEKNGVGLGATYTSLFIGNPIGGKNPGGSAYMDSIALSCIIETEKLFGLHGGHFTMSALQQDGGAKQDLSANNVGSQIGINDSVIGGETMKFVELSYDQLFWNDKADIKLGRVCAMDEFDVTPIYWNYVGNLRPAPLNMKTTYSPNASWGSRLKVAINPASDARIGIYQITQVSLNGLNWNFYPNDGVALFGQYNWNPEFFKPGSSYIFQPTPSEKNVTTESPEKKVASQKSVTPPLDASKLQGLPSHFFVGGYYSTTGTSQFTSATSIPYAYSFYLHGDQMVYRPNPLSNDGLTLWSAFTYAPDQNDSISLLTFQAKGGAIYNGLLPGRKADATIFGVSYGTFSSSYTSAVESQNNGDPTYALVYELGYRINLTQFFYVQPDMQWVINPSGTGSIPNALVLGVMSSIVF